MRFEILGPLRVRTGTGEVAVTAGRERLLLAMLLLHTDQLVSVADLVDAIWSDDPPGRARNQVQKCVLQLRRLLAEAGPQPIVTEPAGYRLDSGLVSVDLLEFRALVGEARQLANDEPGRARDRYREALALWRGAALAGLDTLRIRGLVEALEEQRRQVLMERIEVELALGGAGELVAELTTLVHRHPYLESLHRALMLALYRAGRQADALATYQHARGLLLADLGQEPGPELRELHRRILSGDPTLLSTGTGTGAPPATPRRCMPWAVSDFAGRRADLEWLRTAARPATPGVPAARVLAIDGMAGVGKTTLVLRAARLLTPDYPDAQLFIDLHGHSEHRPLEPAAALDALLRQLGTPTTRIPADLTERVSWWRSPLAGQRALVVLDNAATAAQVRPLLPAAPGCLTLVTSRRRLVGLDGATPLSLRELDDDEAVALLTRIAGDRVRDEPDAAREVVRRCGNLPLAIRLAAARLAHRPSWRVRDLADRLAGARRLLGELSAEDRTVADALSLSYTPLPPDQQRLFRLLALHPGGHVDEHTAAALADLGVDDARKVLEDLVDRHLLLQPQPGSYRYHDLVREYARQLAEATLPDADRRGAVARLLDYYLHGAAAAAGYLAPTRSSEMLRLDADPRPDLARHAAARGIRWLQGERDNLVTAVVHAAALGFHDHAWQLAIALWDFLYEGGHLDDLLVTQRHGMAAAQRLADDRAVATMHNYLASAYFRMGEYERSAAHLRETIRRRERLRDLTGVAGARMNLAALYQQLGRLHDTADLLAQTLETQQRLGTLSAIRRTLSNLGNVHTLLGNYSAALRYHRRDLSNCRPVGDTAGLAKALGHIGTVRGRMGEHRPARRLLWASLRLKRQVGNRTGAAEVLSELGALCRGQGQHQDALAHHREALEIVSDIGDRPLECLIRNEYGRTLLAAGDVAGAWEQHRAALATASKIKLKYEHARALDGLGACLRTGKPEAAARHWRQALAIYAEMGCRSSTRSAAGWRSWAPRPPASMLPVTPPVPPLPYRIDNEANREVVDEAAAVAHLAALAGHDDLASRGQRVATLRVVGRLEEAEREGRAAYDLAVREGTPRQQAAALLRLAHVLQFRRDWAAADAMFAEAMVRAKELDDPLMVAFAHQHTGRNYVDQGRLAEAVVEFQAALALREAHGAPADQLESTRGALRAAEARLTS